METKYVLDGLTCAHCAGKIEDKLKKDKAFSNINLNFALKTLTVDGEVDRKYLQDIIDSVEDGILLKEAGETKKKLESLSAPKFVLNGLTCTHCAGKIEEKLKEDKAFSNINLNFSLKTLTLDGDIDKDSLQELIDSIEDGIVVEEVSDTSAKKKNNKDSTMTKFLKGLIPIALSIALLIVGYFMDIFWLKLSIFVVSYIIVGGEIVIRAIKNLLKGDLFDENFLMSIATIGAFAIGEYFEGVAVMIFYQLGELVQDLAVDRARDSVVDLMDIRPDYANLVIDGKIRTVDPKEVGIGDVIAVKASEKVSLDGVVIEGKTELDTSSLTGESMPVAVEMGDDVLSGSINMTGTILIKVTKSFGESTVSKIMDMVENASNKKAKTERFITKFAKVYTPIVVFLALAIILLPPIIMGTFDFVPWISRGLIFLVVSCPCALVISVPLSYFGGIGGASRSGILVKGGNYLESLTNVGTVVFDKTGTITEGKLSLADVYSKNTDEEQFLNEVVAIEAASNHPIAKCIVGTKEADALSVEDYREFTGLGVFGKKDGHSYLIGNEKLMNQENVVFEKVDKVGTVLYVAKDGEYQGYILLSDSIKEESKKAISELKKAGIKTVMLTGDNDKVASHVANEVGLDEVYSELLPHEKVEKLESFMSEEKNTIFVGDGINDAPALARSDIGFAMGGIGSDAATNASDVVIMNDDITKIFDSIKISRKTKRIVWENIIIALGIKVGVMLLASLGMASMWAAIFADVGVALIAILNSVRIIRKPM